jgi:hypothetical protein
LGGWVLGVERFDFFGKRPDPSPQSLPLTQPPPLTPVRFAHSRRKDAGLMVLFYKLLDPSPNPQSPATAPNLCVERIFRFFVTRFLIIINKKLKINLRKGPEKAHREGCSLHYFQ